MQNNWEYSERPNTTYSSRHMPDDATPYSPFLLFLPWPILSIILRGAARVELVNTAGLRKLLTDEWASIGAQGPLRKP